MGKELLLFTLASASCLYSCFQFASPSSPPSFYLPPPRPQEKGGCGRCALSSRPPCSRCRGRVHSFHSLERTAFSTPPVHARPPARRPGHLHIDGFDTGLRPRRGEVPNGGPAPGLVRSGTSAGATAFRRGTAVGSERAGDRRNGRSLLARAVLGVFDRPKFRLRRIHYPVPRTLLSYRAPA